MADLLKPKFQRTHDGGGDGKGEKRKKDKSGGLGGNVKETGSSDKTDIKNVSTNVVQVEKANGAGKPATNTQAKAPKFKSKGGPPPARMNAPAAQPQQGMTQPQRDNTLAAAPPQGGMSLGQAAAKRLA